MSSARQLSPVSPFAGLLFALTFCVAASATARAQAQPPAPEAQVTSQAAAEQPTPTPDPAAAEAEAVRQRLSRARALAAIGRLAAAAAELESLRSTTKEESVRDVSRLLLMAIFVEMPDYSRAAALLDEAFKARPAAAARAGDAATHFYFALAGQTVNAVRTHIERYRSFGVNVADASELPAEAASDVEQLRILLERVVEQARALHAEQLKGGADGARGLDAAALLEDAATVRLRIARGDQDRSRWQGEVSEARQHLFSSESRVASISPVPGARPAPPPAATAAKTAATAAPTNNTQRTTAAATTTQPAGGQGANAAAPAGAPPAAPPQPNNNAAAPAAKADNSPVAVGSLAGKARSRATPTYPPLARAGRVTGSVTVFLVVSEKGEVESVIRADGPQQLQQAAIEAARRWKFNTTEIDGRPVRVTGYLNFNFTP